MLLCSGEVVLCETIIYEIGYTFWCQPTAHSPYSEWVGPLNRDTGMRSACGFINLDHSKLALEEILLRNSSAYDGSTKIYIVGFKKKNKELSVGLLSCRMFCVAKTFLLCTRWSFLWYVWTYCMCYYLTRFLNVWSYFEMQNCAILTGLYRFGNEDTNKSNFQEWLLSLLSYYAISKRSLKKNSYLY